MTDTPSPPRLLHGMLPVLRDPGGTGMVTLGWPGDGRASDCITDPSELPDCEITLKAFPNASARAGYQEAMADLGGNAVSWSAAKGQSPLPHLLLVFRHDRPRREGATLEEAIPLHDVPADGSKAYGDLWRRHCETIVFHRNVREHAERWEREIQVVRSMEGVMLNTDVPNDTITFYARQLAYTVSRDGDGIAVDWCADGFAPRLIRLDQDLSDERVRAIAESGATETAPSHMRLRLPRLDAASASRVIEAGSALHGTLKRLYDEATSRKEVRRPRRAG